MVRHTHLQQSRRIYTGSRSHSLISRIFDCVAGLAHPSRELLESALGACLSYTEDHITGAKRWPQPKDFVINLPATIKLGREEKLTISSTADICDPGEHGDGTWTEKSGEIIKALVLGNDQWPSHVVATQGGKRRDALRPPGGTTPCENRRGVARTGKGTIGGPPVLPWQKKIYYGMSCSHAMPADSAGQIHRCPTAIYVCGLLQDTTQLQVCFINECCHDKDSRAGKMSGLHAQQADYAASERQHGYGPANLHKQRVQDVPADAVGSNNGQLVRSGVPSTAKALHRRAQSIYGKNYKEGLDKLQQLLKDADKGTVNDCRSSPGYIQLMIMAPKPIVMGFTDAGARLLLELCCCSRQNAVLAHVDGTGNLVEDIDGKMVMVTSLTVANPASTIENASKGQRRSSARVAVAAHVARDAGAFDAIFTPVNAALKRLDKDAAVQLVMLDHDLAQRDGVSKAFGGLSWNQYIENLWKSAAALHTWVQRLLKAAGCPDADLSWPEIVALFEQHRLCCGAPLGPVQVATLEYVEGQSAETIFNSPPLPDGFVGPPPAFLPGGTVFFECYSHRFRRLYQYPVHSKLFPDCDIQKKRFLGAVLIPLLGWFTLDKSYFGPHRVLKLRSRLQDLIHFLSLPELQLGNNANGLAVVRCGEEKDAKGGHIPAYMVDFPTVKGPRGQIWQLRISGGDPGLMQSVEDLTDGLDELSELNFDLQEDQTDLDASSNVASTVQREGRCVVVNPLYYKTTHRGKEVFPLVAYAIRERKDIFTSFNLFGPLFPKYQRLREQEFSAAFTARTNSVAEQDMFQHKHKDLPQGRQRIDHFMRCQVALSAQSIAAYLQQWQASAATSKKKQSIAARQLNGQQQALVVPTGEAMYLLDSGEHGLESESDAVELKKALLRVDYRVLLEDLSAAAGSKDLLLDELLELDGKRIMFLYLKARAASKAAAALALPVAPPPPANIPPDGPLNELHEAQWSRTGKRVTPRNAPLPAAPAGGHAAPMGCGLQGCTHRKAKCGSCQDHCTDISCKQHKSRREQAEPQVQAQAEACARAQAQAQAQMMQLRAAQLQAAAKAAAAVTPTFAIPQNPMMQLANFSNGVLNMNPAAFGGMVPGTVQNYAALAGGGLPTGFLMPPVIVQQYCALQQQQQQQLLYQFAASTTANPAASPSKSPNKKKFKN